MTPGVAGRRHEARHVAAADRMPELMERVTVGDRAAFAAFYDLLAPQVFRLVVSVVGDG